MDVLPSISNFLDELLALRGAYGFVPPIEPTSAFEATAVVRLRLALYDVLVGDGWTPPPHAAQAAKCDGDLLREPDDDRYQLARRRASQSAPVTSAVDPASELEQMRRAMESRAVIEQAKGMAMERYGLTAPLAWSWLVRTSQDRNAKLRDIAEELVSSVAQGAHAHLT
jgi:hypothetical protein